MRGYGDARGYGVELDDGTGHGAARRSPPRPPTLAGRQGGGAGPTPAPARGGTLAAGHLHGAAGGGRRRRRRQRRGRAVGRRGGPRRRRLGRRLREGAGARRHDGLLGRGRPHLRQRRHARRGHRGSEVRRARLHGSRGLPRLLRSRGADPRSAAGGLRAPRDLLRPGIRGHGPDGRARCCPDGGPVARLGRPHVPRLLRVPGEPGGAGEGHPTEDPGRRHGQRCRAGPAAGRLCGRAAEPRCDSAIGWSTS